MVVKAGEDRRLRVVTVESTPPGEPGMPPAPTPAPPPASPVSRHRPDYTKIWRDPVHVARVLLAYGRLYGHRLWWRSRHAARAGLGRAGLGRRLWWGSMHAACTVVGHSLAIVARPPQLRRRLRAMTAIRPRLGVLRQHAPRALVPPRPIEVALAGLPSISIVTPSWNQAPFIERTMRSVLDQAYPHVEYVVMDGGSSDGTVALLERYDDRLRAWASAPDNGQADAINRGFAATSGEVMAWLNSDDMLLLDALPYVGAFFRDHSDVDVVYGQRVLIDDADREIGRWILPRHDASVLKWADYVPQETMFWRRRIWERVGGRLDESFQFALDWDLLLRFQEVGARFACLPRFIGAFRIHEEQKTSSMIDERGIQEMGRLRERTLGRVPKQPEVDAHVSRFLMRHLWCHALYGLGVRRYDG